VVGFVNHTYAEQVCCEAEALTLIPDGLDETDAAALPLVTLTGAQLIERGVQPQGEETVLVTGAAGSVGRSAVYVAKELRCRVIAGVRAKQKDEAAVLHADQVVALDGEDELRSLAQLDAIADTVDGDTAVKLISKLKQGGRFASVLAEPDALKQAGIDVTPVWAQPDVPRLRELATAVRDRRLSIPISRRMRLSEIREAHAAAEKGANGKILLLP
jgi:NADPH:quinone reductase-like Zn-dependent oxidoreductase